MKAATVAAMLAGALSLGGLAGPVVAGDGAAYGACVAAHATAEGGLTLDHNPGKHRGFSGWTDCHTHR